MYVPHEYVLPMAYLRHNKTWNLKNVILYINNNLSIKNNPTLWLDEINTERWLAISNVCFIYKVKYF